LRTRISRELGRAKEGFDFREATLPALELEVNLTEVCHEESALRVWFTIYCKGRGPHNTVPQVKIRVAVLEGREVWEGRIGPFVDIRSLDWMGFGVPSDRKCITQLGRVKVQLSVRLDGKDFDLRHLDCGVVGVGWG